VVRKRIAIPVEVLVQDLLELGSVTYVARLHHISQETVYQQFRKAGIDPAKLREEAKARGEKNVRKKEDCA